MIESQPTISPAIPQGHERAVRLVMITPQWQSSAKEGGTGHCISLKRFYSFETQERNSSWLYGWLAFKQGAAPKRVGSGKLAIRKTQYNTCLDEVRHQGGEYLLDRRPFSREEERKLCLDPLLFREGEEEVAGGSNSSRWSALGFLLGAAP
ncbi:hypothetical protein Cni_G06532 [Canna indica]|uniref:Uncharacterized protein n=1 Tax=Canna indica TaxID=4628 RepID=A0AAQ3Q6M5_9LILI|nr:hypothetical protein Cni_G06532 [Canna indica]